MALVVAGDVTANFDRTRKQMGDCLNLSFIRQRIPESCCSLIHIFTSNEKSNQLEAADRWLMDATASHYGQNRFVWGELLTDLAHCYPLTGGEILTM